MTKRLWITTTAAAVGLVATSAPALAADPSSAGTLESQAAPAALYAPVAEAAAVAAPDVEAAEQAVLARTNQVRAAEGAAPLTRSTAIDAVAEAWAAHMATTGDFRHNPDFFRQIPPGWRTAGENIAMNSYDPAALITQWENSPGHRANLVNPAFTAIGIAVVEHGGLSYGVQVFGGY
ncbi:CAP domain-containing protein [Cellulomonas sp. Marseille-Q8402]